MRALPLLLLCATACPKPLLRPPGASLTPAELTQRAAAATAEIASLSAEARVGAGGLLRGTVLFLLARPNQLRFDALLPGGQPVAAMVSDGVAFALLDLRAKVFYRGAPTPENLGRLFGLAFDGDDLVRALLGEGPLLKDPEREDVRFDAAGGEWVLTQTRGPLTQTLRYDSSYRLKTAERKDGAAGVFFISYGNYKATAGGVVLAHRISFKPPGGGADLEVRLQADAEINGAIQPGAFTLTAPGGVKVVPLP
jgi:hypothetical protein